MRPQDKALQRLIAEQAAEWHVAQSDGGFSPHQAREFMRWLRTSPIHVAEYLTIAKVAKDVADAAHNSTASLDEMLAGTEAQILQLRHGAGDRDDVREMLSPREYWALVLGGTRLRRAKRRPIIRWAPAVAALVLLAIGLLAGLHWRASRPTIETFATRHGQERSLRLPDGTAVQLDSDSAMTIRFDGRSRHVTLDHGQAYFKVAKDPERTFSVRAGRALIRDIGTVFDVYRHTSNTTVTVTEGHVQVWHVPRGTATLQSWLPWHDHAGRVGGKPVADLRAGEQARVTDAGQVTSLGTADMQQVLAWTHGRIAFESEAVAAVAAQFNRYNVVQVSVANAHIAAQPISGVFDAHDLHAFLAFVGTLPNVRIARHGQHVVVTARRSPKRRHD